MDPKKDTDFLISWIVYDFDSLLSVVKKTNKTRCVTLLIVFCAFGAICLNFAWFQDLTDEFAGLEAGKRQWEWIRQHSAARVLRFECPLC